MSLSNEDKLCYTCSKVELDSLINERAKYTTLETDYDEFWYVSDVVKERNCPLCRLLIHCFRIGDGFNFESIGALDQICGLYVGRELQVTVRQRGIMTRSSYSIQACGTSMIKVQEHLERIDSTYFNIQELNSWLGRCDETHPTCKPSNALSESPTPSLPIDFRLIDVRRGCIVRAGPNPIYCALSYVWGGVDQLLLKNCNLKQLGEEGALFGSQFGTTKTINDAIGLCKDIGQTYLWVDCLCIIQDEEDDKRRQISLMDAIYNRASLTVVAAAGEDANAGLSPYNTPRVCPAVSISHETISDSNLVSSLSPEIYARAIMTSKWATRGWTLQEYALSQRVVIFTGRIVFFRCKESLSGEDFGLQLLSFCGDRPDWDLPLYRLLEQRSASRHYSNSYPQLVAQYIRRDLTKEDDILNAFLGILARLIDCIGPHIWGLPSKEFGSALLWSKDLSFPIKRRRSFPSWSWARWMHASVSSYRQVKRDDLYQGVDLWDSNSSLLKCFRLGGDADFQCFDDHGIDRFDQIHLRAIQEGIVEPRNDISFERSFEAHFTPPQDYERILNLYSSGGDGLTALLPHCVFFWTSCAWLCVDRNPSTIYRGNPTLGRFPVSVSATNRLRDSGYVFLDVAWRKAQPDKLEFVMTTFGSGWNQYLSKVDIKLGLMLVESIGNTAPTFYRRIPASNPVVYQSTWISAEPQQRLVALI